MKVEIHQGGVLKWTIESTDNISQNEFVSVIKNASMSSASFIKLYYDYYTEMQDHEGAYERVERLHENLLGRRRYSDYESFRSQKSYHMNKNK